MDFLNAPPLWAELRADTLHVFNGTVGEDVLLTLDGEGRPDDATRTRVTEALVRLAPRKPWQTRSPLWCALPARGVSIRKVRVPVTPKAVLRGVLQLQVEASFPIPPEELAWGWFENGAPAVGGIQEVAVAAVRRQSVEPWAAMFASAGFDAGFTLASVARTGPQQAGRESFAALDLTARTADFAVFKDGIPTQVRALPWSLDRLAALVAPAPSPVSGPTGALAGRTAGEGGCPTAEAVADDSQHASQDQALSAAAAPLIEAVRATQPGNFLLLTGNGSLLTPLIGVLENALSPLRVIASVNTTTTPGRTDAVIGLQSLAASVVPLRLALPQAVVPVSSMALPATPMKWALRAAALLIAVLLFPYAEAFIGWPILTRKLEGLKKDRARLGEIDRRLDFLEYLSVSQPPYLDASFVVAEAAPRGTKIDSFTLNRRGEISLTGYAQQPPQAIEFRTKLMDSKFFSSVVVEELTPVQNNQRVNFRITAQWKGAAEREALQLGPVLPEALKTNAAAGGTNAPATNSAAKPSTANTNPPATVRPN